jgi:diguanylate cyclase (GGDEF)-like protein
VLLLGLDDFHRINATLGHDAGDEVLIQVARRFQGAIDPVRDPSHPAERSGEMAARIGADEFGSCCAGCRRESARASWRRSCCARRASRCSPPGVASC